MEYSDFLRTKKLRVNHIGFESTPHGFLYDFQRDIVSRALLCGRFAMFADCGLGKTPMQLSWAQSVADHTGKPVLIFAPLAVAEQTRREGDKFGITVTICQTAADVRPGVNITNYEKIHHYTPDGIAGIVLDESGILKNYGGHYRKQLTDFASSIDYRLCCTATPAPNDLIEIINHAEFLGVLSGKEAIALFFKTDGNTTHSWRLKHHAETDFWRWMASWAVAVRMPSDLGYANNGFILPELRLFQHTVSGHIEEGFLFQVEAHTMQERRQARRESINARVDICASLALGGKNALLLTGNSGIMSSCGKKNTQTHEDTVTPPTPKSGSDDLDNAETKSPIRNTCANTTQPTRRDIACTKNKTETKSMPPGDSGMQPMNNTVIDAKPTHAKGRKKRKETGGLFPSSELQSKNTKEFLQLKEASALFAENLSETENKDGYTSTTATAQEGSAGFCVPSAILESENSRTARHYYSARQNTYQYEPWIIWCHLNKEQDALARILGDCAISIYGALPSEEKTRRLMAWLDGERPILLSKPSIIGYGINMQHCRNMAFVGLSDSFEELYQGIRRCWRFGQKLPVNVHLIVADTEGAVMDNVKRKEREHAEMMHQLAAHMGQEYGWAKDDQRYDGTQTAITPVWLGRIA